MDRVLRHYACTVICSFVSFCAEVGILVVPGEKYVGWGSDVAFND